MTGHGAILNPAKGIGLASRLESRPGLLDIATLVGAAPTGYGPPARASLDPAAGTGPGRVAGKLTGKIRN